MNESEAREAAKYATLQSNVNALRCLVDQLAAARLDLAAATLRAERAERVVEAVRKIRVHRDQRRARTRAMQEASRVARNGGPSGSDAIEAVERATPIVFDLTDVVNDVCDALAAYDRETGARS